MSSPKSAAPVAASKVVPMKETVIGFYSVRSDGDYEFQAAVDLSLCAALALTIGDELADGDDIVIFDAGEPDMPTILEDGATVIAWADARPRIEAMLS